MSATVLEGIAPIVPVRDVAVSTAFYTDVLGFDLRTGSEDGSFALLARGEAGLILLPGDEAALKATAANICAYIWVSDLMALWYELKPRLDPLPEGRVRAPFEQSYGMREFHVKDPDGFLIFFGQSV